MVLPTLPPSTCHSRGLQVSLSHGSLRHKHTPGQVHTLYQARSGLPREVPLSGITSGTVDTSLGCDTEGQGGPVLCLGSQRQPQPRPKGTPCASPRWTCSQRGADLLGAWEELGPRPGITFKSQHGLMCASGGSTQNLRHHGNASCSLGAACRCCFSRLTMDYVAVNSKHHTEM